MSKVYSHERGVYKQAARSSKFVLATWMLVSILGLASWVQFDRATRPQNTDQASAASASSIDTETDEIIDEKPQAYLETTSSKLEKLLTKFSQTYPEAKLGISIDSERGDFSASLNPNQEFLAASLYKTVAAYRVLQMVQNGLYELDDRATGQYSIEDCIELAITVSDNPCGIALQSLSSPTLADAAIKGWGYTKTTLSGYYPETSAKDQNKLFSDIYDSERLEAESHEFLLEQLKNQRVTNRMPELANATIYHKTGDVDSVVNSSAFILTDGGTAYAVAILTEEWDIDLTEKYAAIKQLHSDIHALILEHETNL